MSRVHLARAESRNAAKPGEWSPFVDPDFPDIKAILRCPECGVEMSLRTHRVTDEGMAEPSLVCPQNECSWHVWGQLDGWPP